MCCQQWMPTRRKHVLSAEIAAAKQRTSSASSASSSSSASGGSGGGCSGGVGASAGVGAGASDSVALLHLIRLPTIFSDLCGTIN